MDPIILRIEPELDERAATATMTRAQRVYEQGARDISKVMRQQLTQGTEAAGKGFDELETKARKAYLGMQDASEKVAAAERKHQAAVEKGAANAESLGRKVERARLAEIEAIEKATAAYKEYGQAADQAGNKAVTGFRGAMAGMRTAGTEAAGGFMEGFAGSSALMRLGAAGGPIGLALAGIAAVGVAAGKVLSDNIAAGMEQLRTRDLFQARLGVDAATMERVGTAAGNAWTKGFGGSVEENLKTISAGISAGLISAKSSDSDLAKFAERMDTTSKITGQDPTEIASKSRNIVRNGLAADYTEILDLLNSQAGKQLNISGDLLDSTEEYATAWHGVGISAADAFGLMKQMSDAGIRNTDVAADSLKELSINIVDGSKLTKQAFTVLGFDAEEMNRKFATGGSAAREALGAVLTALRDLKDPQDKENAGAALFKTKWEDAKTAIKAADLKTAATDMGQVAGATDDSTKQINKHADSWKNLGNTIANVWDSLERKLADSWLGKFIGHDLPDFISDTLTPHQSPDFSGGPNPFAAPQPNAPGLLSPGMWGPHSPGGPAQAQPPGSALTPGLNGLFPGMLPQNAPPPPPGLQHGPQDKHWADAAPDDQKSKSLPPAPVLPLAYTSTAGLPSSIANAVTSLDERKHDVAEKEARLHQLEQTNVATADDIQKAKNDLTKAQQDQLKAEQSLNDARVNAMKQANKQMAGLSSDLDQLGASLDKDFGISKGLGGIVENLVKAVGNALAAPFLQALGLVSKANPNEGSGLVGIMAANGAFGQQYTPGAIAAAGQTGAVVPGGAYMPAMAGGAPSEAQVKAIAASFGLQVTSEDRPGDPGYHGKGMALDVSNGSGNTPQMRAFADYMSQNFGPYLKELIYSDGSFNGQIGDGKNVAGTGYYSSGTLSEHQNHVHVAAQWGDGAANAATSLNGLAGAANAATQALGGGMSSSGFNWDAVAAKESSGNWQNADTGRNGHYGGLQFSPSTWNTFGGQEFASMPHLATREQQMAVADRTAFTGYNGTPPQGLSAWEVITNGSTAGDGITVNSRPPGGGGGPMYPGIGPSQALPGMSPLGPVTPAVGGGTAYPSVGGNSGNVLGGLPMSAISSAVSAGGLAIDAMAPGAGQAAAAAAKIGIQVANRSIGYAAQNAGIAANAVGEFFSVGDNPKGSIGAGWLGKLAGGFAGAAPALPNLAGGKKPPGPMDQAQGGQQGGNVDNSQTNINVTAREGASGQEHGEQIAAEQGRMFAPAGRQ